MAQPMRKQPWLQRLLAIIGTGLERAARALRRQNGEPVSNTPPADPEGPPAHWLELLSKSQVPLVWIRQEAYDPIQPDPPEDGPPRAPRKGTWPADGKETAASEIPAMNDYGSSRVPILPAVFPETSGPELPKKSGGFPKPQGNNKTRQLERSGHEDRTPKLRPRIPIIRRPSIPSEPQSAPRPAWPSAFRLVPTAKVSRPDRGSHTKQTISNLPRYVHPQRQSQVEPYWPEVSSEASAIAPRYETSHRSGSQDVSVLEVSTETNANKNLFPEESLSVDRWPSLPPDWLATEPETSVSWLEQAHQQRLEQERRGE